ncbi:ATP-binding cassette domain-containing protein [Candidatus Bathyarchaeota archaeon]|nr:ATP-binding cassette domain-containing protein [Candidatus Bathyarchaeota archaeon]
MRIRVKGARENNLKNIDVEFGDGLTVVTGVSGSGKTSLVFDTIHHEAQRRMYEIFTSRRSTPIEQPAKVDSITGIGPTVAVGQNLLNRNPNSTLATASGLHPFLRLLFSRFGTRICERCSEPLNILTVDEIVSEIAKIEDDCSLLAPLIFNSIGSHSVLLSLLTEKFGSESLIIDGENYNGEKLDAQILHNIVLRLTCVNKETSRKEIKEQIVKAEALGCNNIIIQEKETTSRYSSTNICPVCGMWFKPINPHDFNERCPNCNGIGCPQCKKTGLKPEVVNVTWKRYSFKTIQDLDVNQALRLFYNSTLPEGAERLLKEIVKRLEALNRVGLGYIQLNRSSPTLSRGESQRVRLAVSLKSDLEDILHVLDEPTIGQHPSDVLSLVSAFRELKGPVIYVEHDRVAAALADNVVDVGPGAGSKGGEIVFSGSPVKLWEADTVSGQYFSLRKKPIQPKMKPLPLKYLTIKGANKNNLKNIDVKIPWERLTVVTGVSGSGKSTLIEDVLVKSLSDGKPVGCQSIEDILDPILVDQSPIGRNPHSTPATYTKLSELLRKYYAKNTGLSTSCFSFNRPEGACPECEGMGAIEIKMRYLPSCWVTCTLCEGRRFKPEIAEKKLEFHDVQLSIADFYELTVEEAYKVLSEARIEHKLKKQILNILKALKDIGLGYLRLGQPSPSLSGGEAQRIKLAKYLGRSNLTNKLILLDEPSTGLHPQDITNLLNVLDNLVDKGATIVVVEHNLDIIRFSDWIIDLGPGAGPSGGEVLYNGTTDEFIQKARSLTAKALREESKIKPKDASQEVYSKLDNIVVKGAKVNNLKDINVSFPKNKITVVTGVSGSGKSSLVSDTLEVEAKRRYLESLSMYERQGTKEGPEAPVDEISGLGVTVSITPERRLYSRRSTVGTVTEIDHNLAVLFSLLGKKRCTNCGEEMVRDKEWICPLCGSTALIADSNKFDPKNYSAACTKCNGVGTLQKPNPSKLIINPSKPLCSGAMYSPGFFPQGYLCKPGNGGYDVLHAFAEKRGFSPEDTPWNQVPEEIQNMFYYGDPEPIDVTFNNLKGRISNRTVKMPGFYSGYIRDWDVGGTYTDIVSCPECGGAKLRPEYLEVKLTGYNIYQLENLPLSDLSRIINEFDVPKGHIVETNYSTIKNRLRFLNQVGLSYINLNRVSATLSAGEAQRIKLAGLLGSGLTSLTIILDEPSRGLHPSEVNALFDALKELCDEGNTVIIVEHDPEIIRKADHIIELGPGPGVAGGKIVAEGTPETIIKAGTVTGKWIQKNLIKISQKRRQPKGWMKIIGAKENNLKDIETRIPLGVLTGICGVSGSGKSTLIVDTLGRALNPQKHTTSVAKEPLEPGAHDSIIDPPKNNLVIDQTRTGISNPSKYLGLDKELAKIYSETIEAVSRGITFKHLMERCDVCSGSGTVRIDMEFLPDIHSECEACRGTGYKQEAWDVKLNDLSLPELNSLTLTEIYNLFKGYPSLTSKIKPALDVGLGYLVLNQQSYTLSGGEAQRLKIAAELTKKKGDNCLYILDEPSIGQHLEDIKRLNGVLNQLVDEGNSVIIVEHCPQMLVNCDWLLELGPVGGPEGGYLIAEGTPETVSCKDTPTSPYLKVILEEST